MNLLLTNLLLGTTSFKISCAALFTTKALLLNERIFSFREAVIQEKSMVKWKKAQTKEFDHDS